MLHHNIVARYSSGDRSRPVRFFAGIAHITGIVF
ncbi:hypothetical protein L1278_000875 [Pontibacter sp. HSC-36F09]|nr:hypothetical protein [Pontibacter sp. HSC-36F09]